MKLHGQKLSGPNVVPLYLPRGDDQVIVIKCQAVLDYAEFHKLCPQPEPPVKILRGGGRQPDFESSVYKKHMLEYGLFKTQWMLLQSLKATEGLEWENVDMSDVSTWKNYEKELIDSGFSDVERQRILNCVMEANALNESKLEEARERFLSGQIAGILNAKSTSPNGDQNSTPSGELVKEPASALPV